MLFCFPELFVAHVVPPLSHDEELELLQAVAPSVDVELLRRVAHLFAALRRLHSDGALIYPFSTREALAVARHLERFREDGVGSALESVFAHEIYDSSARALIRDQVTQLRLISSEELDGESGVSRAFLAPGAGALASQQRQELTVDSVADPCVFR